MSENGGQSRIVIPEPDEGYKCAQIYFFDAQTPFTIDAQVEDLVLALDAFKTSDEPWLVLYEPVWQLPVMIPREAVERIMGVVASFVKLARPTSTRRPIETARRVPLTPPM